MRSINELYALETFEERYDYLKTSGHVAEETFGGSRWLNQMFYNTPEWKRARRQVIIRDNGCDLGCTDRPIASKIIIHHLNPITKEDIVNHNPDIYNPDFLVCVSFETHQAIHYGAEAPSSKVVERRPNDTAPWKV